MLSGYKNTEILVFVACYSRFSWATVCTTEQHQGALSQIKRGIDIMDLGIYTTTHLKTDHSATTAYTTSLPLFLRDSTRTHFMSSKSGHALSPQFIHQIYTAVTPQISITSLACHEYIESGSAPRLQCTRPPQTLPFHTSTIA